MLKKKKVSKRVSEIISIGMKAGDEWGVGCLTDVSGLRGVRVAVRKDENNYYIVFCVAFKGSEVLSKRTLYVLDCEECAKAFALQLVFGVGYAVCVEHQDDKVDEITLFDGTIMMLCSVMGITDCGALDMVSQMRIMRTAKQLMYGEIKWQKAITAWEKVEKKGLPINEAILWWDAAMRFGWTG